MLGIEHWLIEGGIVLLGAWAVWKSLPRDPNIPWVEYQSDILGCLDGAAPTEPAYPKPFTLLEWSDIQSDSVTVMAYIQKRLQDWIPVGREKTIQSWDQVCPSESMIVDWSNPKQVLTQLEGRLQERSQRFIFVASTDDASRLLKFLHANPPVRDFTGAIVLMEPELDADWMQTHFNDKEMDVEANVSVPYFVCQEEGESFGFVPATDENGWKAIEVVQVDSAALTWFRENNRLWVQLMAMLMVKRKESV